MQRNCPQAAPRPPLPRLAGLFALLRLQPGLGLRVGGGQVQGQGVMPDIEPSADRAGEAVDEAEGEAETEHGGAGRFDLGAETRIEQVRRGRETDRRRSEEQPSELKSLKRISYSISALK